MKSPSHFLRFKKKNNPFDIPNLNNNYRMELNYVTNLLHTLESTYQRNMNKMAERDMYNDREIMTTKNFRRKKNTNTNISNNLTIYASSGLKNTNLKLEKKSIYSSSFNSNNQLTTRENNVVIKDNNIKNKPRKSKQKYLDINQIYNISTKISKTPKASKSNFNNGGERRKSAKGSLFLNFVRDYNDFPNSRRSTTINKLYKNTNIQQFDYYQNNEKIFKLNENIQNEIESKELKKKVHFMKKTIIQNNSLKDLIHILGEEDKKESKLKNTGMNKKENLLYEEKNEKSHNSIDNILSSSLDDKSPAKAKEKNRKLKRIKGIYDSFDDEEYEEGSETEYYISPSSYFIIIFDWIIFLCSMFYLIHVPYYFSSNIILTGKHKFSLVILTFIDFIFIFDIIINFFRAYQNFDENLVRKMRYIFFHYISTWFIFDFIQAIPFFTFFKYKERKCINNNICSLEEFSLEQISPYLYLLILIKIIKVYKMLKQNSTISTFGEILSQNEFIDNHGYIIFAIFYSLIFLNFSANIFIFIGRNTYPGWILKIHLQDSSFVTVYIAAIYYIVVTITTVGYGDITGSSYIEIGFQMFLLIIGTLAYSFVISYISNYIIKKNEKSRVFEKNLSILKEIKMNNPLLKDSVYQEVIKNLFNEQLYERKDKSLLFDCLPYSLKNKLIMEMYKPFIHNFVFFKNIGNTDFIVKVVTSLKPLLSFKGNILIQEGDYIKEIFFIKKGSISLNINIDKDNLENSLRKYLDINEELGTMRITYMPTLMLNNCNTINWNENFNDYFSITKKENKSKNKEDILDIKIIEIRKNEHFGDALMFLNERSPLVVKVRTKVAELLVLRKMEAIEIYSIYPNIWKRINKKSLFNMEQIKEKIKREIIYLAKKYGSQTKGNQRHNSRSLQKIMSIPTNKENSEVSEKIENNENKPKLPRKSILKKKPKYSNFKIQINGYKDEDNNQKEKKNQEQQKEDVNNYNKGDNYTFDKSNNEIKNENYNTQKSREKGKSLINDNTYVNGHEIDNEYWSKLKKAEKEKIKSSFDSSSNSEQKNENSKNEELLNNNIKKSKLKETYEKYISKSLININRDKASNKLQASTILFLKGNNSLVNKSEHLYFSSFINLISTNEDSFELISSYENLNKITNNTYIKNHNLQSKTKQFLIKELSSSISHDSIHDKMKINKNPLNGKIKKNKRKYTKDDLHYTDNNKSINSLDISNLKSNRNYESVIDKKVEKLKTLKFKRLYSNKNVLEKKQSKVLNLKSIELINRKATKSNKKRRKSEHSKVNRKLNMISKNIEGANKNINNPDQFYMDLFNNIINKGTGAEEDLDKKKNNTIDTSPERKANCSEKNSPTYNKNINKLNSILSSDDIKYKRKKKIVKN